MKMIPNDLSLIAANELLLNVVSKCMSDVINILVQLMRWLCFFGHVTRVDASLDITRALTVPTTEGLQAYFQIPASHLATYSGRRPAGI